MIRKTLYQLLTIFLFTGCNNSDLFTSPKNQTIYKSTLKNEQYLEIYEILADILDDFPENRGSKINYDSKKEDYHLKIKLNENKIKFEYYSDNGENEKITKLLKRIKSAGTD